jgi:hypothetical protein
MAAGEGGPADMERLQRTEWKERKGGRKVPHPSPSRLQEREESKRCRSLGALRLQEVLLEAEGSSYHLKLDMLNEVENFVFSRRQRRFIFVYCTSFELLSELKRSQ